jgi:heme/copper-type cytochrome/quinol oxidase subunit 2
MRSLNAALRQFVPLLLIAAVMAVVAVVGGAEALGCPNCKDAVNTSDPDGLNVARGYFYSILLMLAMPFTLVGSFGAYVWREMRRQKAAAATGETQEHSAP